MEMMANVNSQTSGISSRFRHLLEFRDCVDIWAPGADILSLNAFGSNTATAILSGTSMSCPHVVGVVAGFKTHMTPINAQDFLFVKSIVCDPTYSQKLTHLVVK